MQFEEWARQNCFHWIKYASLNSGKDSDLILLLQEELPSVAFPWCFAHQQESFEDALKVDLNPVNSTFMHFYYIYEKW